MMTLEEAIKHCKDVALYCTNKECALEHFQLLKWLKEYSNMLEKQGEQKPVDKAEPKFKVGDEVVWDNRISCHIDNVYQGKESLMYTITDAYNMTRSYGVKCFDNNAHLWTIEDAKDGDVLSDGTTIFIFKDLLSDSSVMSYCDYDTNSGESDAFCPLSMNLVCSKITPATKEQRDTIMKAMAEARYTFDFEKKELKKIEQNPAWTELDEIFVNGLIRGLSAKRDIHGHTTFSSDCIDITETIRWLKSLRGRYTWKPSEKQIKALEAMLTVSPQSPAITSALLGLYEQLKKLKGE